MRLREWVISCKYRNNISSNNDVVVLRDAERNVARDDKNDPVLIQKLIMHVCPISFHNLILKYVQDGGFDDDTYCDRKRLISVSALRKYWPNWVVPLTK